MARDPHLDHSAGSAPESSLARWEQRAMQRVMENGGEQLLQRSRRIVEAAYGLLEDGLEELTIRAVLAKTGLSRRAFYERFSGKDDLVVAVFEHTILLAAAHYREQFSSVTDPMKRLQLVITSLVLGRDAQGGETRTGSDRRGAAMSREHLRLAESRPEELEQALRPLVTLIADELSAGMAAGTVRDGDPRRLANLVYNLVSTTVHKELLAPGTDRVDRAHLAAEIWDFCRRAVAA